MVFSEAYHSRSTKSLIRQDSVLRGPKMTLGAKKATGFRNIISA